MANPSFSGHRRDDCEGKIFQRIDVAGEVTITPKVECGPVSVTCLEGKIIPGSSFDSKSRGHARKPKCKVLFVQELLVEVPVEFHVEADCNLVGIRCSVPTVDPSACLPEHGSLSDCIDSSSGASSTSCSWDSDSSGSSASQDWSRESGGQC